MLKNQRVTTLGDGRVDFSAREQFDRTGVTVTFSTVITVTKIAAEKIRKLHDALTFPDSFLRVFVDDGGCTGCDSPYQYGMSFDVKKTDDIETVTEDLRVLIDPRSMKLLVGAVIDFGKTQSGENFIITNPNAKTTCGCGRAFG